MVSAIRIFRPFDRLVLPTWKQFMRRMPAGNPMSTTHLSEAQLRDIGLDEIRAGLIRSEKIAEENRRLLRSVRAGPI